MDALRLVVAVEEEVAFLFELADVVPCDVCVYDRCLVLALRLAWLLLLLAVVGLS